MKKYSLNCAKVLISLHGLKLRNYVLDKKEKDIQSYSLFQKKLKSKLLQTENETKYF